MWGYFLLPLMTAALLFGANMTAPARAASTTTPIKNVVIIYPENRSFDHYFGTYPVAQNNAGETPFTAKPGTPGVNGLANAPRGNIYPPTRLAPLTLFSYSPNHQYTPQQYDFRGLTALTQNFVLNPITCANDSTKNCLDKNGMVTGYYDGNTVTALWNYAQYYGLSDAFYNSQIGPSAIGHLNLASGRTSGASFVVGAQLGGVTSAGTMYADIDPAYDDCSSTTQRVAFTGNNVGDLLNAKGVTWGYFQGGFRPTARIKGKPICNSWHYNVYTPSPTQVVDYVPHHEPFQYYPQTANPHHNPPTSPAMVGYQDQANHQYDVQDLWDAAAIGNLPEVVFIKPPAYQNGHATNSHPLAEQTFIVNTINQLQSLPQWSTMAIFIARDDSGGWYDHVVPPVVNYSNAQDPAGNPVNIDVIFDTVGGTGCIPAGGAPASQIYDGRCGPGPRMPLLVISPYARVNNVDSTMLTQSSLTRFIEDNWGLGRLGNTSFDAQAGDITQTTLFNFTGSTRAGKLVLNPSTGSVVSVGDK